MTFRNAIRIQPIYLPGVAMTRRGGFTLTELLVSMALIVFVMLILTQAFSSGLETFRRLKAVGDMQERLRGAVIVLRRDLRAQSLKDRDYQPRRLSDFDFANGAEPPAGGYFRLMQVYNAAGTSPNWCSTLDATDAVDGSPVTRATEHLLAFTCRLRGVRREDFIFASFAIGAPGPVPPQNGIQTPLQTLLEDGGPVAYRAAGTMVTQWYEVAYWLRPLPNETTISDPATGSSTRQLYALHRRIRALPERYVGGEGAIPILPNPPGTLTVLPYPPATLPASSPTLPRYADISTYYNQLGAASWEEYANSLEDVTDPPRRLGMTPVPNAAQPAAPAARVAQQQEAGLASSYPNPNWHNVDSASQPTGEDILLTDVVSFDVKVLWQGQATNGANPGRFSDLPPANAGSSPVLQSANLAFNTQNWRVFDTWSRNQKPFNISTGYEVDYSGLDRADQRPITSWNSTSQYYSMPLRIRVQAVQISLRIWDRKTEQTRQVTIIEDL